MAEEKKNIVWLVSYPKSGNTWFRIFLCNLMSNSNDPQDLNNLNKIPIASSRRIIDQYLGVNSSELTQKEIANLRPQVYRKISENPDGIAYFKTHDAWTINSMGFPIFPQEITKGVIYIIRNPLDIVVSYSFHSNKSIDQTIKYLNNNNHRFCSDKNALNVQTQQMLKSWSNHVVSWIDNSKLPVHIMRYEDMLGDTLSTFRKAINFLGFKYSEPELLKAISSSSFSFLRALEEEKGFKERSIHSERFFREGVSNNWLTTLSKPQVRNIRDHHSKIMNRFGYS